MATESSLTVMFRAVVMLACLVVIPLVALFGNSLPEVIKSVAKGRWPTGSGPSCAVAADTVPRFEPFAPVSANGRDAAAPANATVSPVPATAMSSNGPPPVSPQGVSPAGYEAAVPAPAAPAVAQPVPPIGPGVPRPGAEVMPQSGLAGDKFAAIQARLRQLGATYVLLETWGNQQELWRFYCKIAVGGNPNCTQYFEATDADHLRAAAQVLQAVEIWRAGRQ